MKKPLVSVIIPVYNVEKYLPQCLDSVIGQTYTNIEVICVNDGSPDDSIAILRRYEKEDSRIKVLEIENHGLSYARNIGTKSSRGEYILYLDSDDWIDVDTIEVAVDNACQSDVDLVIWNYMKEYSNNSSPVDVFTQRTVFRDDAFQSLHQQLIGLTGPLLKSPEKCDSLSTAWGKLYRASIIKDNELAYVDTKIIGTEDLLFNAEYFNYCKSAIALPNRFSHYRKQDTDTLVRSYKPSLFRQWMELQKRLKNACNDKEFLNHSYSNRIALSIIGLGINVMKSPEPYAQKHNEVKTIISLPQYRQALAKIELEYMPIHWKFFFWCAKHRWTHSLMFLLYVIYKRISRN